MQLEPSFHGVQLEQRIEKKEGTEPIIFYTETQKTARITRLRQTKPSSRNTDTFGARRSRVMIMTHVSKGIVRLFTGRTGGRGNRPTKAQNMEFRA